MAQLAILGGQKIRTTPFPAYTPIGEEERKAVDRVFNSHIFSKFIGAHHPDFHGGPEVQALEKEWAAKFNVKHAISVNSATAGLFAAVGALGISPGDEVIVSPYTMSASVTAVVAYGGIPVFADIEADCFCIDPQSVEKNITPKTKAILGVDIFGQPFNARALKAIAQKHNLPIIEDTAQSPGALFGNQLAGTLGDIGIYSLNYHKHIHSGEGGIIVTNNDTYAEKMKLIRNHAEAVLGGRGYEKREDLINMVGFNYRMTEIEAAIAREQLKKLDHLIAKRIQNVEFLNEGLKNIPFVTIPKVRDNCTHVYYVHAMKFDFEKAGISRERFVSAIKAELPGTKLRDDSDVLMGNGYTKPLYLLPMYKERIAFGREGYPFTLTERRYEAGLCPVAERMHFKELFTHELMRPPMDHKDLQAVIDAFKKVTDSIASLRE